MVAGLSTKKLTTWICTFDNNLLVNYPSYPQKSITTYSHLLPHTSHFLRNLQQLPLHFAERSLNPNSVLTDLIKTFQSLRGGVLWGMEK